MKRFFILLATSLYAFLGYSQKVSNVLARQSQSSIIVSYQLETSAPCEVRLYYSNNGGKSWNGPLQSVSGDVGEKIVAGSNSIIWSVLEEYNEFTGNNIIFKVIADGVFNEEEVTTQDMEETLVVKETPKKKNDTKKEKTDVKKEKSELKIDPPRRPDPNSLFKGNKNKSVSQGTGVTGSGDEGNHQGDPNSKYKGGNGTGGGKGNGSGTGTGDGEGPGLGTGKGGGVSFSLSGRKWNRPPPLPRDNTQETGKVVVDITVDKNGQVITATPGGRGSTTTSAYLFRLAKEAALKAKFDENPDAADIQRGTITFIFVVQ